jgi:hypothetical protein
MTPFELTCACGRPLRGDRQRRAQVLSCPACGRPSFVFPVSPFDLPPEAPPAARHSWRTPLLAALASLVLLVGGFVLAWPYLVRRAESPPAVEGPDAATLLARAEAGRAALIEGKFHVGRRLVDDVLARRDRMPGALTAAQNRDLNQLQRQADLLARLSTHTLEEIIRQGMLVREPEEWAAQFADYRGRTVVFDDSFRRDADGRPVRDYRVEVGEEVVRVAFEELELFQDLPLDDSPRLIFGARLAGCRREEGGGWVVRLEPDSAVLLTDPDLWEACSSADFDDDTRRVLERQRQILAQGGPVVPARP